jgi:hypothetical protein
MEIMRRTYENARDVLESSRNVHNKVEIQTYSEF